MISKDFPPSEIEDELVEAIACGEIEEVSSILIQYPASSWNSDSASRFLGRAIAGRRLEMIKFLIDSGFRVSDLDPYLRVLPASLGQEEIVRLLQ